MDSATQTHPYQIALQRIETADLPATVYRTARRLLDLSAANGQINFSWKAFERVTNCNNRNAARRHLTILAEMDLIHFSTNDYVYITWLAWLRADAQDQRAHAPNERASAQLLRAETPADDGDENATARQRAETARTRAATARWRAVAARDAPPIGLVGLDLSSDPDLEDPSLPKPTQDAARIAALLADPDVGLDASRLKLRPGDSFEWVERLVFAWRRDLEAGAVDSPGALKFRIERNWAAGPLTPEDKRTALYRRHHPDAPDPEAAARRRYIPQELSHAQTAI